MNICILGYPRVDGSIGNGVAKATFQFTKYFEGCGDKVYNYHFFTSEQYADIYDFCLTNKIDVAIWNMSTLNIKGRIKLPCPLISVWHSSPFFKISDDKLRRFHVPDSKITNCFFDRILIFFHKIRNQLLFSYIAHKSNYLVLFSDGFKKGFLPAKLFPNRIVAIPNSIRVNEKKHTKNEKRKSVLYVGRIRSEKKIDTLLKIWHKVEKCNNSWNLIIVGDGPDIDKCKSLSKDLMLRNIKWEGWASNPEKYYSISKIFCLTSEYEGFPMVLLEAQASGCVPVVFGSFESAYDIISNDYNGYVIPPFNIDEYAEKLLDLMNNEEKLNKMSNNAMASVNRFEEISIMNRWRNLVDSVVSDHN